MGSITSFANTLGILRNNIRFFIWAIGSAIGGFFYAFSPAGGPSFPGIIILSIATIFGLCAANYLTEKGFRHDFDGIFVPQVSGYIVLAAIVMTMCFYWGLRPTISADIRLIYQIFGIVIIALVGRWVLILVNAEFKDN